MVVETFAMVQSALTLAGYAVLLVRFHPLGCSCSRRAQSGDGRRNPLSNQVLRMRNCARPRHANSRTSNTVLANGRHAKEVKLLGIGPLLLDRYRTLAESFYDDDGALDDPAHRLGNGPLALGDDRLLRKLLGDGPRCSSRCDVDRRDDLYVLAFRQGQQ